MNSSLNPNNLCFLRFVREKFISLSVERNRRKTKQLVGSDGDRRKEEISFLPKRMRLKPCLKGKTFL